MVSCESCSPRCLSPGCLRPFLLAPFGQLAPSTLPSLNSHLSSRLPFSNRVNTFLCCCTGQHSSDFLAAGAPHVLLLEPIPSLSYFSSICARNMLTRISLDIFLNHGLQLEGVCINVPPLLCTPRISGSTHSIPFTGQQGTQFPR